MTCIVCNNKESEYYCRIKDMEICMCLDHVQNGTDCDSIDHITIRTESAN